MALYDKLHNPWVNRPGQTTRINAAAMNYIEEGIYQTSVTAEAALVLAAAAETPTGAQTKANEAKDRATHTGSMSADNIIDGILQKAYLATERIKLAGIATSATANATNAQLRDRATHTGTQDMDSLTETAGKKVMTAAERTKLGLVEDGANLGIKVYEFDGVDWNEQVVEVKLFVNRLNNTTPSLGGPTGYTDGIDIILLENT